MTTEPQTLTLAAFLSARLDDDEAAARAFVAARWSEEKGTGFWPRDSMSWADDAVDAFEAEGGPADPARVLADVEAKRRIVALCEEVGFDTGGDESVLAICTLRLLALPYASHDDYRAEWAP